MSSTHFKLSKPDGLIRRLAFPGPNRPTWSALATKISTLYNIPQPEIGVSYLDADGDEVTLSTDEELQEYYQVSFEPNQPIKFTVQDLRALRESSTQSSKPLPDTPRTNVRNTFGVVDDLNFDLDDEEWQRLPLGGIFVPRPETPHAFVEVVESDASVSKVNDDDADNSSMTASDIVDFTSTLDKGKGKALEDDAEISSTASVLAEDAPTKPPIHVFDVNTHSTDSLPSTIVPVPGTQSSPAESTPKAVPQTINTAAAAAETPATVPTTNQTAPTQDPAEDPPLPSLDSTPPNIASFSLTNDVAALLNTVTAVFSTHPELSEGIRNIVQNAKNGAYWAAHREALSNAAQEIAQTTGRMAEEYSRNAEDEAGRRVAEAVGGIVRSFAHLTATASGEGPNSPSDFPPVDLTPDDQWNGHRHGGFSRYGRGGRGFGHGPHHPQGRLSPPPFGPPWMRGNHPPPPPFAPWMRGGHSMGPSRPGGWGSSWNRSHPYPPPVPSPPPPPTPPLFPGDLYDSHHHHNHFGGPHDHRHRHPSPPPPPPPPPGPPGDYNALYERPDDPGYGSYPYSSTSPGDARLANPYDPMGSNRKPTPEEMKAEVEAAKARYVAQKERYRREREERKRERNRQMNGFKETSGDENKQGDVIGPEPEITQVVSNARGPYPELEMVSVFRRHNTHPGHGGPPTRRFNANNGADHVTDELTSRAIRRITRRLGDMGFTETSYPALLSKIKEQLPSTGVVTKEAEDDIVTNLLEQLLAMSPKPPVASGSGLRDRDIPGAWR